MNLDANYWTERYELGLTGWDAGSITTPLKEYFDQLDDRSISILIPGAGNAYEAEYLLTHGFSNTWVIDLSPVPLANLKARVPDCPSEQLIEGDFFRHTRQYDLIIEQTFFCAIAPGLRPAYASKMHELLKTGGKLVGVLFNDALNADRPPFGGFRDEYLKYFEEYFDINVFEPCHNSIPPRAGRELFINLSKK